MNTDPDPQNTFLAAVDKVYKFNSRNCGPIFFRFGTAIPLCNTLDKLVGQKNSSMFTTLFIGDFSRQNSVDLFSLLLINLSSFTYVLWYK